MSNVLSITHGRKHVYTCGPQYCVFCMFKDCSSGSANKSSLLLLIYYTAYIVKISFQAANVRKWWRIELLRHQSKILFNISVTCQVHSYTHKAISVSKQKFYFKSKWNQFTIMFHYAVFIIFWCIQQEWRKAQWA